MRRLICVAFCVSIVLPVVSGCLGAIQRKPFECVNDTPHIERRTTKTYVPWMTSLTSTVPLTKEDYRRARGEPTAKELNEKGEIWIYREDHLWCGAVIGIIIGVPLLLPVCDEFEKIQFEGNNAVSVHSKIVLWDGFLLFLGAPGSGEFKYKQSDCLKPLPGYTTGYEGDVGGTKGTIGHP